MRELHPPIAGIRPVSASIVRYPGIPALQTDTERYRCKGGGTLVVRVEAGDRVTLIDCEGGQACELSFLDEKGRFQSAGLGYCLHLYRRRIEIRPVLREKALRAWARHCSGAAQISPWPALCASSAKHHRPAAPRNSPSHQKAC